jgi:hypothetical protein
MTEKELVSNPGRRHGEGLVRCSGSPEDDLWISLLAYLQPACSQSIYYYSTIRQVSNK